MKPSLKIILVLAVFFLGLFFRLYRLSDRPVHLSMDEVAIGYNAYSILKTGRDEWGVKYPLAFLSVGDYKPPVNIYLTAPSIMFFGLTEFAVRFPTALFGSLSVIVFILILLELGISFPASLFGGFWLAILPWHIHFSRATFEAITALFFLMLGVYAFLYWVNHKKQLALYSSIITFSLSVWAYHSERLFVPLLALFLLVSFWKKIAHLVTFKKLIGPIAILLFLAVPFIKLAVFTPAIRTRAAVTSILREQSLQQSLHHPYISFFQSVFDNNNFLIFRHWSGKYLNYFDIKFWFWKGMQFTPVGYPDLGLLYLADAPLFILGIYYLLHSKNKFLKQLVLFWFLLGPLPASFAMNEQHPLRALTWLPAFGIIISLGVEYIFLNLKKLHKLITLIYIVAISFNVLYFADIYLNQSPSFNSEFWQYGYKEISQFACQHRDKYQQVFISDTFGSFGPLNTGTPYLYYLFYCQYDPQKFINDHHNIIGVDVRRTDWKYDSKIPRLLIAASPWDILDYKIPPSQIIKKIDFLNGRSGFILIETNPQNYVQKK